MVMLCAFPMQGSLNHTSLMINVQDPGLESAFVRQDIEAIYSEAERYDNTQCERGFG